MPSDVFPNDNGASLQHRSVNLFHYQVGIHVDKGRNAYSYREKYTAREGVATGVEPEETSTH